MTEELYIIIDAQRRKLDLNSPSGIVLEYQSNLFGDLSKIESSHSYTFKLPNTTNNAEVLGNIGDIRTDNNMRRISGAEYIVNGINLIKNGYLYVSNAKDDTFSCVFTWEKCEGLAKMSEKDIYLNELEGTAYYDEIDNERDDVVYVGTRGFTKASDYTSTDSVVRPIYHAGVKSYQEHNGCPITDGAGNFAFEILKSTEENDKELLDTFSTAKKHKYYYTNMYAVPNIGVPVRHLLNKIGTYYGLTFELPTGYLDKLCVLAVKKECTEGLIRQNYIKYKVVAERVQNAPALIYATEPVAVNNPNIPNNAVSTNKTFTANHPIRVRIEARFALRSMIDFDPSDPPQVKIKGYVYVDGGFGGNTAYYTKGHELTTINGDLFRPDNIDPRLYQTDIDGNEYKIDDVINDNIHNDVYYHYALFNFSALYNGNPVDEDFKPVIGETNAPFTIEIGLTRGDNSGSDRHLLDMATNVTENPEMRVYFPHKDIDEGFQTNVYKNLPSISCSDFIKNLLYIIGVAPKMTDANTVGCTSYESIVNNVRDGNAYDWSDKLIPNDDELSFSVSDIANADNIARTNYFLMKNESIENDGRETPNKRGEDWYMQNYSKFQVNDESLDDYKVVYTSPFYGAFLQNAKQTKVNTYNNQRYFVTENNYNFSAEQANPIIAELVPIDTYYKGDKDFVKGDKYLTIKTWQFPEEQDNDDNMCFMESIMRDTKVLKVKLRLSELNIANIDYSIPVYLSKYNSFFAIQKIRYYVESGIAQADLIKLPNLMKISIQVYDTDADTESGFNYIRVQANENVTSNVTFTIQYKDIEDVIQTTDITITRGENFARAAVLCESITGILYKGEIVKETTLKRAFTEYHITIQPTTY